MIFYYIYNDDLKCIMNSRNMKNNKYFLNENSSSIRSSRNNIVKTWPCFKSRWNSGPLGCNGLIGKWDITKDDEQIAGMDIQD